MTFAARTQASYWQNSQSLWTHAIACTSDNAIAHTNLAQAFFKKGKMDEAIEHYQKALQIDPNQAVAHSALGLAFLKKGRLDEAVAHLQKALEITPDSASTLQSRHCINANGTSERSLGSLQQSLGDQPP